MCLNSFMTDQEIITSSLYTVPCIDLAHGIQTQKKKKNQGTWGILQQEKKSGDTVSTNNKIEC